MKYFLDSAKLDEIDYAFNSFGIDGVTTNPKHIMNSNKPFMICLAEIANWVKENSLEGYKTFPVSVEINPHLDNKDEMVKMGKEIASMSDNFVIKIPCTISGIAAARILEMDGIRTNLTLVFSAAQAIIAAKNGSLFVSPFLGWKEQNGEDTKKYIKDIVKIYDNFGYLRKTEIICAAVRTGKQIVDCATAGADIITAGLDVYLDSFKHPFTNQGLNIFTEAWDNTAFE